MERGRGSDWLLQGHERPEATRLTASLGCGLVGQTLEPEKGGPGPESMADGPLNSVTAPRSMEPLFLRAPIGTSSLGVIPPLPFDGLLET